MRLSDEELFRGFIEGLVEYAPKDFDEGFGTVYERYVMDKYLRDLKERLDIKTVLEGPSDGITGIRGINSYPFADEGGKVTYYTPSEKEAAQVRDVWDILDVKKKAEVKTGKPLKFPFEDDSFNLVWNFCIIEHLNDPFPLAREMVRVSDKYVLFMTQNVYNMGTIPHVFYHKFYSKPWDHGALKWMRFGGIKKIAGKLGLNVVDEGVIDVPPWPDTWDMPVRGFFKKGMKTVGGEWNWSSLTTLKKGVEPPPSLVKIEKFENLPIPVFFKLFFAHHLYVLCEK